MRIGPGAVFAAVRSADAAGGEQLCAVMRPDGWSSSCSRKSRCVWKQTQILGLVTTASVKSGVCCSDTATDRMNRIFRISRDRLLGAGIQRGNKCVPIVARIFSHEHAEDYAQFNSLVMPECTLDELQLLFPEDTRVDGLQALLDIYVHVPVRGYAEVAISEIEEAEISALAAKLRLAEHSALDKKLELDLTRPGLTKYHRIGLQTYTDNVKREDRGVAGELTRALVHRFRDPVAAFTVVKTIASADDSTNPILLAFAIHLASVLQLENPDCNNIESMSVAKWLSRIPLDNLIY